MRYDPWAKAIYERISGKQKSRRKKAAIALARKIAVVGWALLRDDRDWDPQAMIQVTESFGKMHPGLKETLESMKPKENSDQRKKRLRREAREAKTASSNTGTKDSSCVPKSTENADKPQDATDRRPTKPTRVKSAGQRGTKYPEKPKKSHPQRARKPVPLV